MPNSLPIMSNPKDVKLRRDGHGSLKQIRIYGEDGNPFVNIDFGHDHGQSDPHYHIWDSPVAGSPTHHNRQTGLPISLQLDIGFLWEKGIGGFHDATLTKIIQEKEDIILYIQDGTEDESTVTLKTCIYKSIIGKGKGIIYELFVAKGQKWRQDILSVTNDKKILWRLTGLKSIDPKRKRIENQIDESSLSLVILFPSYGPEIFILCENVEIKHQLRTRH